MAHKNERVELEMKIMKNRALAKQLLDALASDFRGHVTITYDPSGLTCRLTTLLNNLPFSEAQSARRYNGTIVTPLCCGFD